MKLTVPPESLAPLKSPPSKTAPAKSKFRPHQETGAVPLRCAVITRMTVWRTSRLAWEGQPLLHRGIIAGPRFIRHAQVGAQHVNTHLPVVLPVISQARHRIDRGQPDGWWLIATQLLGDRVESFVQGSSALLCERSVQLLALRLQRLVQLLALLSKRRFGVPAGHGLDGGGAAERPACFGSPGFPLARGQLG